MKRIFKYATGDQVPKGAIYLCTLKNGKMVESLKNGAPSVGYEYVWHYFLVEEKK